MDLTAEEMIRRTDELKPNAFTQGQKAAWLGELDSRLWSQVLLQCPGDRDGAMNGGRQLLLPESWQGLYGAWLEAKIDLANGEYGPYAAAMQIYNSLVQEFAGWYAQNYRPADRAAFWTEAGRLAYDEAEEKCLGPLPAGWAVLESMCQVTEAFDGGVSLCLGTAAEDGLLLDEVDIIPEAVGVYRRTGLWLPGSGRQKLYARKSMTGTGTAGRARFLLLVQPGGKE